MLCPSGTVPISVWKLPCTERVDVSDNLLTHFTGENTHGQEFRVGVPYGLGVGLGRLLEGGGSLYVQ